MPASPTTREIYFELVATQINQALANRQYNRELRNTYLLMKPHHAALRFEFRILRAVRERKINSIIFFSYVFFCSFDLDGRYLTPWLSSWAYCVKATPELELVGNIITEDLCFNMFKLMLKNVKRTLLSYMVRYSLWRDPRLQKL